MAPDLLPMSSMDKQQDADLEKGRENTDDVHRYFEEDRVQYFEDDGDDIFEEHIGSEHELDYEPEGAFLD